ncbi:hypothetical protein N7455_006326 [Penicillium solitum]|uniref:uncharacterized protein n=1 Tax=Penicillium solitum TaxID=60172 RepID=UPI00184636E9|nr:hypothetical protein HAV15_011842 [Penicillium sp. str. \
MQAQLRLLLCVAAISLGGAVIGIDTGIIATVIAQDSFNDFMFPPGTKNASSLLGAIVAMSSTGSAVGSLLCGLTLEKLGRKYTIMISTLFTIVGAVFQTAANGVAMMIIGRLICGIALGILSPSISVYISELARPQERGRFIGAFGLIMSIGFCVANWIGYACSFANTSKIWRLELAMQFPVAVVLLIFCIFLPESPRWLAEKNRPEKFEASIRRIYASEPEEVILKLQVEIQSQIAIEAAERENATLGHALIELFSKKFIRRTALAIAVMQVGILSGSLAIQNYQSLMYKALGFNGQELLLISGCYGFMGVVGQLINLAGVSDKWPRVRTMWVGCIVLAAMLSILAALSKEYGSGQNIVGARAGVAFIFIYSALYAVFFNSTLYAVAAEIFPQHLRGYGTGVAAFCQSVSGIWIGQVTPFAFDAITWKYYFVFIGSLLALGALYAFFLVETNNVSLEEIAGRFGDHVISADKVETAVVEKRGEQTTEHLEG